MLFSHKRLTFFPSPGRLPTEQRERLPPGSTGLPRLGQAGRPEAGSSAQHRKVHQEIYAQASLSYMTKQVNDVQAQEGPGYMPGRSKIHAQAHA